MPEKIRRTRVSHPHNAGIGVDPFGGPVIDPTENVIALTEAGNKRQDDLRDLNDKRLDADLSHMREMMALRAAHQREMLSAESSRLNSIRQVDQANVQTAADRQLAAIQTLAAQTATNAETLRSALTSTASAIAVQTANTVALINERIGALEKAAYGREGKEAVADPMLGQLMTEVRALIASRDTSTGKSTGFSASWAILLGVVSLIGGLISIAAVGVGLVIYLSRNAATPIYVPAPANTMLPSNPPAATPR